MNLEHLGDALDHWKGAIFSQLRNNDWFRDFAVDPMITNQTPWDDADTGVYRKLLDLEDNEPVLHANALFSHQTRQQYFKELIHGGDMFLDPDTGIATAPTDAQHVTVDEIHSLFRGDYMEDRTILVFQHAGHDPFAARIEQLAGRVIAPENNLDRDLYCCSYECGRVAMLFLSVNRDRLMSVPKIFSGFIGTGGRSVVRMWPP